MQNSISKTKLSNFIDNFAYNKYNKNINASPNDRLAKLYTIILTK